MNYRHHVLYAAICGALLAASPSAVAQQTATDANRQDTKKDQAKTLDTIVVTARKREETLVEVPMNITAVFAEELKSRGINDTQELYRTIAGGATATGQLILRGLSGSNSPSPNTTSMFVDGIPFDFGNVFDVERVEVLRGPQGTLYGSNAIGGTVRMITNKPDPSRYDFFYSLRGTWDRDAHGLANRAELGANLPLMRDTLAMRVSVSSAKTPYPIVNAATGERSGDHEQFIRTQLQWEPARNLHVNIGHMFLQNRNVGDNRADRSQPGTRYVASTIPSATSPWGYEVGYDEIDCGSLERAACFLGAGNVKTDPKYTVYNLMDQRSRMSSNIFSLSIDHDDIAGIAALHYVGSYRKDSFYSLDDWSRLDAGDLMKAWIDTDTPSRRTTHELRLQSGKAATAWDWTAGVYLDRTWENFNPNGQWEYHGTTPRDIAIFSDWNSWAWGDWESLGVRSAGDLGQKLYGDKYKNYNYTVFGSLADEKAAFGETSYTFDTAGGGKIELTGGIRYFWLKDNSHTQTSGIWIGPVPTDTKTNGKESGNRKKLSVSWMPNGNLNLYGLYSEGYRAGGNNAPVLPNACLGDPNAGAFKPRYNSDRINNYELGFKGNIANRMQISGAVYNIDWQGVRASVYMPTCGFSYVSNGLGARSRGIELESSTRLADGLTLTLNGSYTNSIFTDDASALKAKKGDSMTMVPKYNAYVALDKQLTMFGREASAHIDMAAYGKYKSHFQVQPQDESAAYTTMNLSGRMKLNDNATLGLYVSNVLDKDYTTFKNARSRTSTGNIIPSGILTEIYGQGRAFTLRFDWALD